MSSSLTLVVDGPLDASLWDGRGHNWLDMSYEESLPPEEKVGDDLQDLFESPEEVPLGLSTPVQEPTPPDSEPGDSAVPEEPESMVEEPVTPAPERISIPVPEIRVPIIEDLSQAELPVAPAAMQATYVPSPEDAGT